MAQTPFQYYDDQANWGQYQYVTLKEVVNFLELEAQDDDSYLKNVKRSKLLAYAKQGVRLLNRSVANQVKGFQIQVPTTLDWVLPQDYVNYVRISRFVEDPQTGSTRLQPLDVNYDIPTALDYLQDNNFDIMFDNDGNILQSDGINAFADPYVKVEFTEQGGQSLTNTANWSKYGEFSINEERGLMVFSSDLAEQFVLIEYVSDGLENALKDEDVKIHKDIREALQDYVYYECISRKRNVPMSEKKQAEGKWLASRHKAALVRSNIDLQAVSKLSRIKSMIS